MAKFLSECQDCGEHKSDVAKVICPYRDVLYNKLVGIKVCNSCYDERAKRIHSDAEEVFDRG